MKAEDKAQTESMAGRLGRTIDFTPENDGDQKILEYLDNSIRSAWNNYNILSNRKRKKIPHPVVSVSSLQVGGKYSPLTLSVYPEPPK